MPSSGRRKKKASWGDIREERKDNEYDAGNGQILVDWSKNTTSLNETTDVADTSSDSVEPSRFVGSGRSLR
jgi:hypothetical protein